MPPMPPTPRPPRKQGAKKSSVRVPPTSSLGPDRRFLVVAGAAGAAVVVAAVLAFVLVGGGGGSSNSNDVQRLLEAAGCTVKTVVSLPGDHSVATPQGTSSQWNTSPPTNGPHNGVPAIWGAYSEPLLPAQVVHNLEHGGVFVQYGKDVAQPTIDQLTEFYGRHQNGTLLAPLPRLGSKVVIGAWTTDNPSTPEIGNGRLVTCNRFDEEGYSAFFDAYQFHGPERFPADSLLPGS